MEPNKIEKDFKEKLEQRTIQPSEMAWDRLDAMLSVAENKKPKKNRTWMYMAAAFLVFLLVGVLFLNQEKENSGIETNNSVVTNQEQPERATETGNNNELLSPVTNKEAVAVQIQPAGSIKNKANTTGSEKTNRDNIEAVQQSLAQETIASNDQKESPAIIKDNTDKLLADAIADETPKKKSKVKVDPNSLLSAVEEELDNSFKTRVLIGASRNLNAVRSAVANRNYE